MSLPMLSGERPVLVVCAVTLAVLVTVLAVYARPSRHERSVRHYRGEMWE